jgi:hypothetical protein
MKNSHQIIRAAKLLAEAERLLAGADNTIATFAGAEAGRQAAALRNLLTDQRRNTPPPPAPPEETKPPE